MAGETEKNENGGQGDNGDDAAKKAAEATKAAEEADKQKTVPHQALHAEREEHKKTKERLKALEDAQAETNRKAEEEKGNFKTLYEKEQERARTLETELTSHKNKVTDYETKAQARIDKQIESVKVEADKNMIKDILKGKDLADQETLLPTLLEKFGVPVNVNAGPKGSGGKGSQTDRETKESDAKKAGDVRGLIKNAPRL